ncbi:galactonate dehydratase [Aeromicrobium piscarium]|uniref:Galactonate dehydratase n=1 Tax=Aeromicrobium piscarium TaxID=2590901 RepID=A0A554RWE2_9ACTN|nr:galactonate dehydratase [Aeromicrobium piscarium]TSD58410.1 galactonate dehydratase [Aeromicrobium piscarium]
MRISDVATVVVGAELRNWVFVKVTTDEGLVGWGEATLEWQTRAVVGAVDDLRPLLLGEDAMRTEHLWQSMCRHHFFKGGIVTMSAISGIEQALHDVKAKTLGVPLYQLLGGSVRDRLRFYDHLGGGDSSAVYETGSPEAFGEAAASSVADGFDALKILAVPVGAPLSGSAGVRLAVARMAAVREAVGPDVDVMVDLHGRTSPAMAIRYGRALAPYDPWFLEEPTQPEDIGALRGIADAVPVPIATGERLIGRRAFVDLLAERACAVIQPDVCHCGGVAELKRIAALAESYGVAVAPHNPLGPVATAVNVHIGLSTPNLLIQEVMRVDVPWRQEVVTGELAVVGPSVGLPSASGIGVEVDEDAAARHPYAPEPQLRTLLDDGSVADW